MLKKNMHGAMSAWLDTSKPWPIKRRGVDYLPPTNETLVLKLLMKVKAENVHKCDGLSVVKRLERFELRMERLAQRRNGTLHDRGSDGGAESA